MDGINRTPVLCYQGVRVYAIGVGRANMGQLKSSMILNEPGLSNVLHVKNFDSIKTVQSHLLRSVCEDVEPGERLGPCCHF